MDRIKKIRLESYSCNKCRAVMFTVGRNTELVSVNLAHGQRLESSDLDAEEFFFDVNNHRSEFEEAKRRGLIEDTGKTGESGFCRYPSCRLTDAGKAMLSNKKVAA